MGSSAAVSAPAAPVKAVEVAALLERWVRRFAVGNDGRRAAARLEIGAGPFAGAELVVVAEPGHISIEVNLPDAGLEAGLADRLRGRLEGRGYAADVTVR